MLELGNLSLGLGDLSLLRCGGFLDMLRALSVRDLQLRVRLLEGRELLNLGQVLVLRLGQLSGELFDGFRVLFLQFGDLSLKRLNLLDFLNSLLLALCRGSVQGLGLLSVLLDGQSLCRLERLDLELEVGDLLFQVCVVLEELLDLNVELSSLPLEVILALNEDVLL